MVKQKREVGVGANLRLEWFYPDELEPNPANWRRHPDTQKRALEALVFGPGSSETKGGAPADQPVGWAGAALYNETTKHLIDGHLRQKVALAHGGPMPVLVGSWTEEQERTILATLDPIAAMAETDKEALGALLQGVQSGDAAVQAMLAELAEKEGALFGKNGKPDSDDRLQAFEGNAPGELNTRNITFVVPLSAVETVQNALALFGNDKNAALIEMAEQCLNSSSSQ